MVQDANQFGDGCVAGGDNAGVVDSGTINYLDAVRSLSTAVHYVLDAEGRFVHVNDAVEEMLHYTPDELIGRHFSVILPKDEFERVSREFVLPAMKGKITGYGNSPKLFDERRTGARGTKNLEVKLRRKGSRKATSSNSNVCGMVASEGTYGSGEHIPKGERFVGSQGIIFDITEYKKEEKIRLELQKRIFEAYKMDAIGKLAGKVAHDLNNKLSSILGSAEMLQSDLGSANKKLNIYIETILAASNHAADLAERLFEFSRGRDSRYSGVDIHQLSDNALDFLHPTIDGKISVQKNYYSVKSKVMGCLNQLQSTILNVIMNACDAMCASGGSLVIETQDILIEKTMRTRYGFLALPGSYLLFSVQDTGIGMDGEILSKLFEPFFSTKNNGKTIGLGLSSARDCIKSHGGFLDVESEPGKGAKFSIYFPVS